MNELTKIAAIQTFYLALVAAALWAWLRWTGESSLLAPVVCALPVILCVGLAFTSRADQEQYVMRLFVCAGFLPILLMMWAFNLDVPAPPRPMWPWGVGGALLHTGAFVGAVLWLGTVTTRVDAEAGVTPVTAETLQARLLSLNTSGAPLEVTIADGEVQVAYRFRNPERSHRALLTFNSETREVRVRERLSSADAAPETPEERSMRGPAEPAFDPTRPDATSISSRVAQTTILKPERLAATPVDLQGRTAVVPAEFAARLDNEAMMALLCRVITRSGWHWAPGFFGA